METPSVIVTNRGGKEVNEVIVAPKGEQGSPSEGGMGLAGAANKEKVVIHTKAETPKEATPEEAPKTEDAKAEQPKSEEPKTSESTEVGKEPGAEASKEAAPAEPAKKYKTLDEILATPKEAKTPEVKTPKEPEVPKYKDDYIKKVVEYYEATGSLEPVLKALTTDYSKVSDEQMFFDDLREQYPTLSTKALQKIYQREVVAKYHLDASDDDENIDLDDLETDRELFKAEAQKMREAKIKAQAEFKVPESQTTAATQPDPAQIEAQRAAWKERLKEEINTATLLNDKRVAVPYEGGEFNFEVENPAELLDMTADESKVFAPFFKDGKLDLGKFYRVMAYATNEGKFIQSIKTHFKSLGTSEVMEKIKNTKTPTQEKGSAVEAENKINTPEGFLKAFNKAKRVVN